MGARRPAGRAKGVMPSDEIHSTGVPPSGRTAVGTERGSDHGDNRFDGPRRHWRRAANPANLHTRCGLEHSGDRHGDRGPRLCRQPLRDAWDGHRDRTRDPRHRDRAHPMPHQLHHHRWFRWPKRRRRRQTHRHIRDHWKRDNCESGPYPRRRRCVGNRCHVQRRRAWLRPWGERRRREQRDARRRWWRVCDPPRRGLQQQAHRGRWRRWRRQWHVHQLPCRRPSNRGQPWSGNWLRWWPLPRSTRERRPGQRDQHGAGPEGHSHPSRW